MDANGRPFPRGPLLGAGALVLFALVAIVTYRGMVGEASSIGPAAVATREFRFEDRSDGAVAVVDATTGRTLELLAPGTNGFLRATLRGLARERKRQDVGTEPPFLLSRLTDGRLYLVDPTTNRQVDLGAFGPTNAAAFARLLTVQSADAAKAKP